MYSSESGFDASFAVAARRRTASFTICTISPSIVSHSARDGEIRSVPSSVRDAFGMERGS